MGSIPGWGTKIPQAARHGRKEKKKRDVHCLPHYHLSIIILIKAKHLSSLHYTTTRLRALHMLSHFKLNTEVGTFITLMLEMRYKKLCHLSTVIQLVAELGF